jgi:signal transduction histidine kinase/CheY-like chemotaxis protein
LRAIFGSTDVAPDANIADTPMFAALDANESGIWVGPSASDAVVRVHAFRRLPGRGLAVVAGMDQQEMLRPVTVWRLESRSYAGAITGLCVIICVLAANALRASRRRVARAREEVAHLAAANALAEVSRARADATSRRLQGTYAAIAEGVAIFDAHLNLVEWNGLFPDRSGVNASFIRTGMPMEDLLRSQAEAGYFGEISDVAAEVERRAALLRAGNFGASQNFQTDGRLIELRCQPLAEGGFVALYADVTELRRARQGLWDAREALEHERSSRVRFLGVVSYELRERAAGLLRSIGLLRPMPMPVAQSQAVDRVQRAAGLVAGLATDVMEVPQMEAGAVQPKAGLVAVGVLLKEIVDAAQPDAHDRGLTVYLVMNEGAPAELLADGVRIRQIVTLLLAEAVRFAAPDTMWLIADQGEDPNSVALRVTIRGFGTPIPDAPRSTMFRSFDALTAPGSPSGAIAPAAVDFQSAGSGLGPAIARHLTAMMGGQLRCEAWSTEDGRTGNDFILTLPPTLLPGQRGRAPGEVPAEGRPSPRTRVLLVGAQTGVRIAAATMLRRDGHMVETVETGEQAVRALENAPYDIVFIDTVLPDMSIENAAGAVRELVGPARTMPVIALAPSHENSEARRWRQAGIESVLPNPPTLEDLATAIARHVWLSGSPGINSGLLNTWQDESEEGIPILSTERIAELRANIRPDELLEMVEECIADLFHRLPAFRRALAAHAPGPILAQTHAMVGMAGGYGMAVLEARLRAILTATRTRRLGTIDGAADVVEADMTRAASALRRVLRQGQPASSTVQT